MSYEDIYNYIDEIIELKDITHPNLTLDELINITKKKALRLFRKGPISTNINRTQLFRSIIMAASRVKWPKDDSRGLREFWYNPCKPIFYRIFGSEIDEMGEGQITKICDQLSRILSVMVQSRLVRYEDLGIVDFRTQRMLWESLDRADCWSNVVLFVEKDAAYVHLRPLKKLLNITLLSGGGVSKTALNEYIMDRLPKGKYELYTVTDYDPWGFFISGECFMKLRRMGWDIEVIRIGLETSQVAKNIIQNQKYPVKMDDKGQKWAPKYGILGRQRTVYRTRKATIRDPETGKKKKVDEKYLAYEGRKGWGLEIEAVSGQVGGPQVLRELVLEALLKKEYEELSIGDKKAIWKRLKEEDRLDEIKTPLWEEIGWNEDTNPFSKETWENYEKHGWENIKEYITEKKQDELSIGRKAVWEIDRKPHVENVERLTSEVSTLALNNYEIRQAIENITDTSIKLATIHLEEQIKELDDQIRRISNKIKRAGCVEEKLMFRWIQFCGLNSTFLKNVVKEELGAIDTPYNEDIEELKDQKEKTDSIWVGSYVEWFDEVKDDLFVSKTNEEEELSFGLMPGVHMDILKEGGDISDLFSKVDEFDQDRIYNYIWKMASNEESEEVMKKLDNNLKLFKDEEERDEWHEKWDRYREVK